MRTPGDSLARSAALLTVVALVLLLIFVRSPWQNAMGQALQDAGHVIVCGVMAVSLLLLCRRVPGMWNRSAHGPYLLAFSATLFLGASVEAIQAVIGRDAELADLFRDGVGAAVFLVIAAVRDPRLRASALNADWRIRIGVLALALAILVISWGDALAWGAAYVWRNRHFPEIVRFESPWLTKFVDPKNVEVAFVEPTTQWREAEGRRVARLRFRDGAESGIAIQEPFPDWSGYKSIALNLYSDEPAPFQAGVKIYDLAHNGRYHDRFNQEVTVRPGRNRIVFMLSDVVNAPRDRKMDLRRMGGIEFFTTGARQAHVLYIDTIELSKDGRLELASFHSPWEADSVDVESARLDFVPPPLEWTEETGDRVGKLALEVAEFPGVSLSTTYRDWRNHDSLVFRLFSDEDVTFPLTVRVHDKLHDNTYRDRFSHDYPIAPGPNTIVIPLSEIAQAPKGRTMDLGKIYGVGIFAYRPSRSYTFYLDSIALE